MKKGKGKVRRVLSGPTSPQTFQKNQGTKQQSTNPKVKAKRKGEVALFQIGATSPRSNLKEQQTKTSIRHTGKDE